MEKHQKEYGGKSGVMGEGRYLYNKYILVKDNKVSETTQQQIEFEKNFNKLNYETYEIEYLRGYNNGDAHFLKAVKGRYILRLKS